MLLLLALLLVVVLVLLCVCIYIYIYMHNVLVMIIVVVDIVLRKSCDKLNYNNCFFLNERSIGINYIICMRSCFVPPS